MSLSVEPAVFVREFLTGFLEAQLVNGLIPTDDYYDSIASFNDGLFNDVAKKLFTTSPHRIYVKGFGELRLIYLREFDGGEFPFLQGLAQPSSSHWKRKLTCFVGHRFLPSIERSLRFNLRHLFEPHGIDLCWSGYDLAAKDIFREIVSGIKSADLCFFDNLGTLNKPNVYIEVGMAHALDKPMLVSEYSGPSSKGRRKIADTGSVPSDLQGLLRIQYRGYQDLCQRIYFGLPAFLSKNGLRG